MWYRDMSLWAVEKKMYIAGGAPTTGPTGQLAGTSVGGRLGRSLAIGLSASFSIAPRRTARTRVCGTLILILHSHVQRRQISCVRHARRRSTGRICCVDVRFLVKHSLGGALFGLGLASTTHTIIQRVNIGLSTLFRLRPSTNLNGNNLNHLTTYFLSNLTATRVPTVNCSLLCRCNVFQRGLSSN